MQYSEYPRRRRSRRPIYFLVILILISAYGAWALLRPLPALEPAVAVQQIKVETPGSKLAWPAAGQAAVGLVGTTAIETHGQQKPAPTASTAKVVTALVVLDKKPLKPGQQGPSLTITPADVESYRNYAAQDGSLLPVAAGQQLSQYQMLQAIMLPSANNIADTMAIWAFGSLREYANAANAYLNEHGLNQTKVGDDASGMSPATTSTAADLVKLGRLAMANPVLSEIAAQSTAAGFPNNVTVRNVNSLLGMDNIIGIKTGNTEQAGGVFMSASRIKVNNKPVTIITAVMGAPNREAALSGSLALVRSAQANFSQAEFVKAGETVGSYEVPWGGSIPVESSKDLSITAWNGSPASAGVNLRPIPADTKSGQAVGEVVLPATAANNRQTVPLKLKGQVAEPTVWWRLTHPWQ